MTLDQLVSFLVIQSVRFQYLFHICALKVLCFIHTRFLNFLSPFPFLFSPIYRWQTNVIICFRTSKLVKSYYYCAGRQFFRVCMYRPHFTKLNNYILIPKNQDFCLFIYVIRYHCPNRYGLFFCLSLVSIHFY